MTSPIRFALLTALLLLPASCGSEAVPEIQSPGNAPASYLRGRTGLHWELIDFVKPRADSSSMDPYQAPVIYREVLEEGATIQEFGSLRLLEGQLSTDADNPTLYFIDGQLLINEEQHQQMAFLWTREKPSRGETRLHGLRITYGLDGFPAIYEVLGDSSGLQLFFVSRKLEEAAAREFGAVLTGRQFAIERAEEERPAVLVIQLVEAGPTPSGPIVYDGASSGDLEHLHCRCTASQITSIGRMVEYELQAWDELDEELRQKIARTSPGFQPAEWPTISLRLPSSF